MTLDPGNSILDGETAAPQKGGTPLFGSCTVATGQTTEQINMPLDTEVGLGPGDI